MEWKDKARIFAFIRLSFRRSETMKLVKEKAIHPTAKGVRGGKVYTCNSCFNNFKHRQVQVDHIKPVVSVGGSSKDMSIGEYADAVYCSMDNLQVLCKECHFEKSVSSQTPTSI